MGSQCFCQGHLQKALDWGQVAHSCDGTAGCCKILLSLTCRSSQAESFSLHGKARKRTVKLTAIVILVELCITSSVIASTAFIRVCAQYAIM